jgi:hypothetical protein
LDIRYSVILAFMGQMTDRFATYHTPRGLADKLALASKIEGVGAVEPIYPFDFRDINPESFRQLLENNALNVSSVNVNVKSEAKFHGCISETVSTNVHLYATKGIAT